MTRIYLDDTLQAKLLHLRQPLELCDQGGKVVGLVTPVTPGPHPEPLLSEVELQRREEEPDFSTDEVLDYLKRF
jgi:hypothetical protein